MNAMLDLTTDLRAKVHPWVVVHPTLDAPDAQGAVCLGVFNVPQGTPSGQVDAVLDAHRASLRTHWHGREIEFSIRRVKTPTPSHGHADFTTRPSHPQQPPAPPAKRTRVRIID